MPRKRRPLSQFISTPRRYLRSVHLERDATERDALEGYVLTSQARQVMWRIGDGLREGRSVRAWTLTGPYGSGKSAFGVYLSRVLGAPESTGNGSVRRALERGDPELAAHVVEPLLAQSGERAGFLPVLVTGRRALLGTSLLSALDTALRKCSRRGPVKSLRGDVAEALRRSGQSGSAVADLYSRAARELSDPAEGYAGLLLVVDELGQFLEHAASENMGGEVFLLQELAEAANRSSEGSLLVTGILHQSFEQYGRHLDTATRNEWAKVQGRFEDIGFHEPPDQMMRLLAASIGFDGASAGASIAEQVSRVAGAGVSKGAKPPSLSDSDFRALALECYPLHPSVAAALPHLFRRFAQNERSLFSYVTSQEPFGLQELIRDEQLDAEGLFYIRIDDVFDYFAANLGSSLYAHRDARSWTQAVDILDRDAKLSDLDRGVVKAIAVLSVLGRISHLKASPELITYCLAADQATKSQVLQALRSLSKRSIVTFRKFNDSYRLWEGSDLDVEELLADARRKVSAHSSTAQMMQRYVPAHPVVARRHSFVTGALRFFDIVYVDQPSLTDALGRSTRESDGVVVCCLAETNAAVDTFEAWAQSQEVVDCPNLLVAVPHRIERLSSAIHELQSLRWIADNTPGLRDDPVARRELAERALQIEQTLAWSVQRLLDPRPAPEGGECAWYYRGERRDLERQSDVNGLLSIACDALYPQALRVDNELINRRDLSSTVAAARTRLLQGMVESAGEPALGIEGYPPERSIYESLLHATGTHRQEGGKWVFAKPDPRIAPGMAAIWEMMERYLVSREGERVPLQEVAGTLAEPPFGLLRGPLPVLLCAFLLERDTDVALYENGAFVPELSAAVLERLSKSLAGFEVQLCRVAGVRLRLLNKLVKALSRDDGEKGGQRAQLLEVVRQLCVFAGHLPAFAQRTSQVSETAVRVRHALLEAQDPFWLLFRGLPEACGRPAFEVEGALDAGDVEEFLPVLRGALMELQDAYDGLLASVEGLIFDAFDVTETESSARDLLRARARGLSEVCVDHRLRAFLLRVTADQLARNEWLEGIATLLTKKPPKDWNDADLNRFEVELADIRRRFLHLEVLSEAMGNVREAPPGTRAYRLSVATVDQDEVARVVLVPPEKHQSVRDLHDRLRDALGDQASSDAGVVLAALSSMAQELLADGAGAGSEAETDDET